MKCPQCQAENPDGRKFCRECGAKLVLVCPKCGFENLPGDKFCGECGHSIDELTPVQEEKPLPGAESERKYVTVLFSDVSGYTAMSEKLDPEDLKEITTRIFGQIARIIDTYEGFVEKYAGDAVMALFGVPEAHEDDPVRAIRAARDIHGLVEDFSPEVENKIGRSLSMHTGINTGLVVTGEVDLEKGTHGVAGDTVNLAARLSSLAKPGEIIAGPSTFRQAEGYFDFEELEPATVKGKTERVKIYKVLSAKEKPVTLHRLTGLRADLVGRTVEMAQLTEAVEELYRGRGTVFSLSGDAGTGKSRLIEEFKATVDLEEIQWLEGHAYAYAQNVPYFPLIDLLNRLFRIEEDDSPDKVRAKVESVIEDLVGKKADIIPYIGSLYALSYPEVGEVSPEFWKSRLHNAMKTILSALAKRKPTVFMLEDLHWADPSSVELLRQSLLEVREPAIVLCVYRPLFILFTTHQVKGIDNVYQEIRLQDLSPSETQDMLESLLKTDSIPSDLRKLSRDKAEGNPFYLEEVVNSLIDLEMLIRDNGSWRLVKPISEFDISSTIHGVISGRLDRLEKEAKRILQEASVIGRVFLYEILKRITEIEDQIDRCLSGLERLDLIRTRSLHPDLEYVFKHALTQEAVYNGLLKKERQGIHERIALVMEQIFRERLPEFYETLAFHFAQGKSVIKAVDYLVKSGEKALARYAVAEAHQYYKEAFDILAAKTDKSRAEKFTVIDIINSWGYVYYYLGDFKAFIDLLSSHEDLAESLGDSARLGMFYAWYGIALYMAGKPKDSHEYLLKALDLGEKSGDQKVIGYACAWLPWACADLALFTEGVAYGERAQQIAKSFPTDQYLFFKSLAGLCYLNFYTGDTKKIFEGAKLLLDYGERNSNSRSKVMGHFMNSFGHYVAGDMQSVKESSQRAIGVSEDPSYSQFPRPLLCLAYLAGGQFQEAEGVAQSLLSFCDKRAIGLSSVLANLGLGTTLIAKGHMNEGLRMIDEAKRATIENGRRCTYAISEHVLGKVYSQIAMGPSPGFSIMVRNIGFLVKNVPFASKKAEDHFTKAIELAKEIEAKGLLGPAYLDLGILHKAKKRTEKARASISRAIDIFEEIEADAHLKQAREELASLR